MSIAYIGVGSNRGKREENCAKALSLLTDKGISVTKRSSLYETEPWGLKEQPDFINMAAEIETHLEPMGLLRVIKLIEKNMGRDEDVRWGPRVIDLDILLFDSLILKTQELEIPHARLQDREFALRPLAEIAPDKIHPVLEKSIKDLLSALLKKS